MSTSGAIFVALEPQDQSANARHTSNDLQLMESSTMGVQLIYLSRAVGSLLDSIIVPLNSGISAPGSPVLLAEVAKSSVLLPRQRCVEAYRVRFSALAQACVRALWSGQGADAGHARAATSIAAGFREMSNMACELKGAGKLQKSSGLGSNSRLMAPWRDNHTVHCFCQTRLTELGKWRNR